jgi:RNA polymerase sigma-70 factor (ECF subfamily)
VKRLNVLPAPASRDPHSAEAWPMPSDRELLERIRDDRAGVGLETFYRRYSHELNGFAYRALGDRGAADELVQDVFTSVWRHAESYDQRRGSVRTWVYRIARNAIIDRHRRSSVRPRLAALAEDDASEPGALDQSIEQVALRWQVTAALARLTPEHRDVVRLAHYEGMTMREIAEAKGVPIGTIKSRAWHAMRSLRLALEETEAMPA